MHSLLLVWMSSATAPTNTGGDRATDHINANDVAAGVPQKRKTNEDVHCRHAAKVGAGQGHAPTSRFQ